MDSTTTQLMPVRTVISAGGKAHHWLCHRCAFHRPNISTGNQRAKSSSRAATHHQQQPPHQQQNHRILTLLLERRRHNAGVHTTTIYSRVCVVDLAGSDNFDLDGAKEGRSINRGCLAVGRVVLALAEGATHVPYRDYPLTSLLAAILGSTNTTYAMMLTCVSPSEQHAVDTRTTLEYASKGAVIDARERQEYQRIHGSADSTDALQQAAVGMAAARKAAGLSRSSQVALKVIPTTRPPNGTQRLLPHLAKATPRVSTRTNTKRPVVFANDRSPH